MRPKDLEKVVLCEFGVKITKRRYPKDTIVLGGTIKDKGFYDKEFYIVQNVNNEGEVVTLRGKPNEIRDYGKGINSLIRVFDPDPQKFEIYNKEPHIFSPYRCRGVDIFLWLRILNSNPKDFIHEEITLNMKKDKKGYMHISEVFAI